VREDLVTLPFHAQALDGDVDDRPPETVIGDDEVATASQYQCGAVVGLRLGQSVGQRGHVGHVDKCVCGAPDPQGRPLRQTLLGRTPGASAIGHP
jgi:hypothetical protein